MSKLTALITTLVLGSSTVAMADPQRWYDDRDDVRDDRRSRFDDRDGRFDRRVFGWRDRRDGDDAGPRRYRHAWVALSAPIELARGRDVIDVRDRGTFTQLRLQTTNGASRIDRVVVRFVDGTRQVVRLDRVLDPRSPMVEVLLDGNNRRIDRVVVIGDSRRNAAIQLFAI